MKKYTFVMLLFFVCTVASAQQKKEKIKGSKILMIEKKEIGDFETIEISDNLEAFLEKGEKNGLKIEADENLHDIIKIDLTDRTLRISTSKTATYYKKLTVRITYTNTLKNITSRNESIINAIEEMQLNDVSIKSLDDSKLFLNVNAKNFTLHSDNDSKVELNLKSEKASFALSKNANLKALITATDLKFDMYQKSIANIEGDATIANIRLDNNAKFTGNNLVTANAQLLAESFSNCSINVTTNVNIDATGNADVKLYGNPKIEIKRFAENAILSKKQNE